MDDLIYKGWVKDAKGRKIAPRTTIDQVITKDGTPMTDFSDEMSNVQDYIGVPIDKPRNLLNENALRVGDWDGTSVGIRVSMNASDGIDVKQGDVVSIVSTNDPNMLCWLIVTDGSSLLEILAQAQHEIHATVTKNGKLVPIFGKEGVGGWGSVSVADVINAKVMLNRGSSLSPYIPYVPTLREGTIVAYGGSDATGYYVRFANGVQMCWRVKGVDSVAVTNAFGGIYFSSEIASNTYPIPFVGIPSTTITASATEVVFCITNGNQTSSSWQNVRLARGSSYTVSSATVSFFAIGRWK